MVGLLMFRERIRVPMNKKLGVGERTITHCTNKVTQADSTQELYIIRSVYRQCPLEQFDCYLQVPVQTVVIMVDDYVPKSGHGSVVVKPALTPFKNTYAVPSTSSPRLFYWPATSGRANQTCVRCRSRRLAARRWRQQVMTRCK